VCSFLGDEMPRPTFKERVGFIKRTKEKWNQVMTPKWEKIKQIWFYIYIPLKPYLRYGKYTPEVRISLLLYNLFDMNITSVPSFVLHITSIIFSVSIIIVIIIIVLIIILQ
jgi:hypothetical protein